VHILASVRILDTISRLIALRKMQPSIARAAYIHYTIFEPVCMQHADNVPCSQPH